MYGFGNLCYNIAMKLNVVKIPNPILRAKAAPIKRVTPELKQLAANMLDTMHAENGIGLAAPQVGQSVRLFVTGLKQTKKDGEDIPETIIFNPEIRHKSRARNKHSEGCLSIPKITGVVERSSAVTITGLDVNGHKTTISAEGMFARVMQHEIDHLNGVLFIDRLTKYRVVFYGTSEFAVPALQRLIKHPQFDVVAVVTETDKPAGRGHKLVLSPVKQLASANNIPLLQPQSLNVSHKDDIIAKNAADAIKTLSDLKPDFQIVASYGKILPQNVLNFAKIASINLHPSLLPKYRGATPIQSAILHGDSEIGTCIMMMTAEMDAGPVLSMYKHRISNADTSGIIIERLARLSAIQLIMTLEDMLAGIAEYWEQDHSKATYTKKITVNDAKIDWTTNHSDIVNHIRAMSKKPGAWTNVADIKIKILSAKLDQNNQPIFDQIIIPGKRAMSMNDLKNGYPKIAEFLTNMSSKNIYKLQV